MNRKILLVEDNESNRYLATFLLERAGFTVVHAPDGSAALALAATADPALILLDIQLPGMDGYAVARALRDLPALGAVPIIAVTSYAMTGDREKALEAGCNTYLEKPINPETFVAEVTRHLPGTEAKETP
ncbi:MAG: response regulator [Candidatus Didemnitutus sp.]|nr:response regulator [Candidatus Didemnitutus sp.]